MKAKRLLRRVVNRAGYDVVRLANAESAPPHRPGSADVLRPSSAALAAEATVGPHIPADLDDATIETYLAVREYTMTSPERVAALCSAVTHIVRDNVPGDIVECGVWRGGSMLAAARTLLAHGDSERSLWLYDTFEGMPAPTDADVRGPDGAPASQLLADSSRDSDLWAVSPLDDAQHVMALSGYPLERVRYVVGRVEDTLPGTIPDSIALLRLDTDWYESTRHELLHLVPRISPGGVLIIDDYGFWKGARRAVDEYIESSGCTWLMNRIDETGRLVLIPREAGR